jgi:hypothetical protein
MTEAEITKLYDGATHSTKKGRWTVRVTSAAALATAWSYRFTADFIANKESLSVHDVTVRVDAPTDWDRDKVLKRLFEKLAARTLVARTTVILGHQRGSGKPIQ